MQNAGFLMTCFECVATKLSDTNRPVQSQNFGFKKKMNCTIRVAKTKALISFAVTAKLICAFVFAYADCWFSHAAAHIYCGNTDIYSPTKNQFINVNHAIIQHDDAVISTLIMKN